MRARPFGVALTAVLASATLVAKDPSFFLVGNSGPFKRIDTSPSHERSRQLLTLQRNRARAAAAPAAQSQDIGDVAVIVDNGAILVPPSAGHPFDLTAPSAIVFTPSTSGFSVAAIQVPFDPNVGAPLALGDDDTTQVPLGFAVPFLGASYTSVWVNSDGNVTFGTGDAASINRDAARLIGGPPRIAPLLADLDPSSGGTISARVDASRVVVTWTDVPQFGISNANTFQTTIESNGIAVHLRTSGGWFQRPAARSASSASRPAVTRGRSTKSISRRICRSPCRLAPSSRSSAPRTARSSTSSSSRTSSTARMRTSTISW
jgi:hypothetical protein